MIPYAIGFDIGITSVGWAVVALDSEDKPYGIINMGSRVFDAAEQPKTGASLAAPRREAEAHAAGCAVTSIGWSVFAASF